MLESKLRPLKVHEFVSQVKNLLEGQFRNVLITGEISNLSSSKTGHWYFSLSDSEALISCALFKGDALRNPIIQKLKIGDQVILQGDMGVYSKRGSFQIIAKKIYIDGEGDLNRKFELLKKKLSSLGLFDLERKKQIPLFPQKIALITALGGAALQDFLNIVKKRMYWGEVVIINSLMQGDKAPQNLRQALLKAESLQGVDLIILTRGGGSAEDLWAFNDENLILDLAKVSVPTISAIGHQTDYTLCDYVCDMRCETPSAAASFISQEQTLIVDKLKSYKSSLRRYLSDQKRYIQGIERLSPKKTIHLLYQHFNRELQRLNRLEPRRSFQKNHDVLEYLQRLEDSLQALDGSVGERILEIQKRMMKTNSILSAINPQKTLARGYCYLETDGRVLSDKKKFIGLGEGAGYRIHFNDGIVSIDKH